MVRRKPRNNSPKLPGMSVNCTGFNCFVSKSAYWLYQPVYDTFNRKKTQPFSDFPKRLKRWKKENRAPGVEILHVLELLDTKAQQCLMNKRAKHPTLHQTWQSVQIIVGLLFVISHFLHWSITDVGLNIWNILKNSLIISTNKSKCLSDILFLKLYIWSYMTKYRKHTVFHASPYFQNMKGDYVDLLLQSEFQWAVRFHLK